MTISIRDIAQLTEREQRQMSRWIGEESHLAVLSASAQRRRAVRQAMDEVENELPEGVQR